MNWRSLKWLLLPLTFLTTTKNASSTCNQILIVADVAFWPIFWLLCCVISQKRWNHHECFSKPFWFWLSKLVPDLFMTTKQHFLKLKSIFSSAQIVQEKIPTFIIVRPQITLEKIYSFCNNKCKYGFSSRKSVPRIERRTRIRRNTPYKYALLSDLLIDCDRNLSWIAWRQH